MDKVLSIIVCILITSCASQVRVPSARFSTSETVGAQRLSLEGNYQGGYQINPVESYKTTNASTDTASLESSSLSTFLLAFGAIPRLDGEFELNPFGQWMFYLKGQLFGEPETGAGAGNFSVAVRVGGGMHFNPEEVETQSGEVRKYSVGSTATDVELLFGYRVLGTVLLYAGAYSFDYEVSAQSLSGPSLDATVEGYQTGFHLGVGYITEQFKAKLNAAKVKNSLSGRDGKDGVHFGLSMGTVF